MNMEGVQPGSEAGAIMGGDMALIQQAIAQHLVQNPDAQGQVFVIQPIAVPYRDRDDRIVQRTQYQLTSQPSISVDGSGHEFINGLELQYASSMKDVQVQMPTNSSAVGDDGLVHSLILDVVDVDGHADIGAYNQAFQSANANTSVGQFLGPTANLLQSLTKPGEPLHIEVINDPSSAGDHQQYVDDQSNQTAKIQKGYKCDYCSEEFVKLVKYKAHIKLHEDQLLRHCPKCSMTFNHEENLRLHMSLHDTKNLVCPECKRTFTRIASLKSHIKMHEKEETLSCAECGEEFASRIQLESHKRLSHDEVPSDNVTKSVYACRQCTSWFDEPSSLREHMRMHNLVKRSLYRKSHKRNVDRTGFRQRCKQCSKSFQKPSQLERHMRIHTGEKPFRCNQCDKAFNQKGAMLIHLTKHTGDKPHQCDFCPSSFSQKGNLRAHIQRVHVDLNNCESFSCEQCSCVFKKRGSLNAHISRVHSEMQEILVSFEQIDDQTTNSRPEVQSSQSAADLLQQALDSRLAGGVVAVSDQNDLSADNALSANEQNATLETTLSKDQNKQPKVHVVTRGVVATMAVHDSATGAIHRHLVRKVNGVRWHQCIYCSKEFKKPSDVVRHVRIHTHEKPYKCTHCFRAFAVKSTLTAHIKMHSGLKEFKCDVCDKLFATHGSLKVHLRLHTGAKPFPCQHCNKSFRTSGHCKSHARSHLQDNSARKTRRASRRPSMLDASLNEIQLQEPIIITEQGLIQVIPKSFQPTGDDGRNDRPYRCPHCGRGFKKSSHLKQHLRSHTGERPYRCVKCFKSFVSSGVLKAHIRTHSGSKDFRCDLCNMVFTTSGSMRRHLTTHSEVRPFMCPYCQKTFKTAVNCKKHMKTHRQELALQRQAGGQAVLMGSMINGSVQQIVPILTTSSASGSMGPADGIISNRPANLMHEIELVEVSNVADSEMQLNQLGMSVDESTRQIAALMQLQQQHQEQEQAELDQELVNSRLLTAESAVNVSGTVVADLPNLVTDMQLQNALNQQQNMVTVAIDVSGQQQHHLQQQQQPLSNQSQSQLQLQHTLQQTLLNIDSAAAQAAFSNHMPSYTLDQYDAVKSSLIAESQSLTDGIATTVQFNQLMRSLPEADDADNAWNDSDAAADENQEKSGKAPYTCTICKRVFKKSSHLNQHVRSHTGERPYRCPHPQCNRQFVSNGVLKAHIRTHSGLKNYSCSQCTSTFTTNGSLARHMALHSGRQSMMAGKRPLKQLADGDENGEDDENSLAKSNERQSDCNADAISKKILQESAAEKDRVSEMKPKPSHHIPRNGHLSSNQCHTCFKSFKKPSDLIRHIRTHTGEKPYQCHVCYRYFTVKSTLDSHMKTHGPTEKSYRCHICETFYSTKGSLKVHMRLHTGSKPFKCPKCDLHFRTSGHRKSHLSQHFKPGSASRRSKLQLQSDEHDAEQLYVNSLIQNSENIISDANGLLSVKASQSDDVLIANGSMLISGDHVGSHEPTVLQASGVQFPFPVSLSDMFGTPIDGELAVQVLQGIECNGIQLQLAGNASSMADGGSFQIAGLDDGSGLIQATTAVQIDSALLQQLAQQGNISLCIDPKSFNPTAITMDCTNTMVSDQLLDAAAASSAEMVNPNVVMQTQMIAGSLRAANDDAADHHHHHHQQQQHGHAVTALMAGGDEGVLLDQYRVHNHEPAIIQLPTAAELTRSLLAASGSDDVDDIGKHHGESGVCYVHVERLENSDVSVDGSAVESSDAKRVHVCMTCGKGFKRLGHLTEHYLTHRTNLEPVAAGSRKQQQLMHRCNLCPKMFAKPSQLERHVRIHTGERPFACTICKKAFNQKNALNTHLRKHRGERPYSCQYCALTFTQKGNLKTHIGRAHRAEQSVTNDNCTEETPDMLVDSEAVATNTVGANSLSDELDLAAEPHLVNFM